MIKSICGLTSGGTEIVTATKSSKSKGYLSVFTKIFTESLNLDNKDSVFKLFGNLTDLYNLHSLIKDKMGFNRNSSTHIPGCGSFTIVSSLNVSEKAIPIFSSSFNHLIIKTSKNSILERKKQVLKLKCSPYSLYKMVPLQNISLEIMQKELKAYFLELRIMGIDEQNEIRKGKFLSDSFIKSQIALFKEEKKDHPQKEKTELVKLSDFWKTDHLKIILYGRAGIGKVN